MFRVRLLGASLLATLILASPLGLGRAAAQTKEARGTATAVTDSSLKVKVGEQVLTFAVDSKTAVVGRVGTQTAGKLTRDAQAAGAPGIKLTDVVKAGSAVIVSYREAGSTLQASEIRLVSDAGSAGGAIQEPAKTFRGKVKSVTADVLVVTGDQGKDMSFGVDANTKVQAAGAGTATKAAGGRITITSLVGAGDTVVVSYEEAGGKARATDVRITAKNR